MSISYWDDTNDEKNYGIVEVGLGDRCWVCDCQEQGVVVSEMWVESKVCGRKRGV